MRNIFLADNPTLSPIETVSEASKEKVNGDRVFRLSKEDFVDKFCYVRA